MYNWEWLVCARYSSWTATEWKSDAKPLLCLAIFRWLSLPKRTKSRTTDSNIDKRRRAEEWKILRVPLFQLIWLSLGLGLDYVAGGFRHASASALFTSYNIIHTPYYPISTWTVQWLNFLLYAQTRKQATGDKTKGILRINVWYVYRRF